MKQPITKRGRIVGSIEHDIGFLCLKIRSNNHAKIDEMKRVLVEYLYDLDYALQQQHNQTNHTTDVSGFYSRKTRKQKIKQGKQSEWMKKDCSVCGRKEMMPSGKIKLGGKGKPKTVYVCRGCNYKET